MPTPETDPNAQMVEPAIPDEEMTQFLASLEEGFEYAPNINLSTLSAQGGSEEESPEPGDDDADPDEPADEPEAPEPGDDEVVVNGQVFPRADIERLYNFDKFLRDNPDKAQRVAEALASAPDGQPVVSETPAPSSTEFVAPTPPEELDLDDPQSKFLWDQTVEARREAWEARQEIAKSNKVLLSNQQAITNRQAADDMAVALTQFKTQFPNLNDDDIAVIRNEAGPLVGTYLTQMPPVEALKRSMEVAGYANADIRSKLLDPATPNPSSKTRSTRRKARLGSISGTPRSAPKVEARPTYTSDRDMVNEFAQALAENGVGR